MIFSISFLYSNKLMVTPTRTILLSPPGCQRFQRTVTAVGQVRLCFLWQHSLSGTCVSVFQPPSGCQSRKGPTSQAVGIKAFGVGVGDCPSDVEQGVPVTTKMRGHPHLTDTGCWSCGNLAAELDRSGSVGRTVNKAKQLVQGIESGKSS